MQSIVGAQFAAEVEEASLSRVVIVNFTAAWCQPCKLIRPAMEELEKEMPHVKFCLIDIDDATKIVEKFHIMSVPTFMVFHGGERKHTLTGSSPSVTKTLREYAEELR